MIDRGIIKWRPFDSVYSSKSIIKEIMSEKNKVDFPILSEDQLNYIEEQIIFAYNSKLIIKLQYYFNGYIFNITGTIDKIDKNNKKIFIKNTPLYIKQIIKTSLFQ